MPTRRRRSGQSLGTKISYIASNVDATTLISVPTTLGQTVNAENFNEGAVISQAISYGAVDSRSFDLSTRIPSGESGQRVPALLTNKTYWSYVISGDVELHQSGIHGGVGDVEDIKNVEATDLGIKFTPLEDSKGRIYLTGRLPIPPSRKIYATWVEDGPVDVKLICWDRNTKYRVTNAKVERGLATLTLDSTHTLGIDSMIRVTNVGEEFDGLFSAVRVGDNTISYVPTYDAYSLPIDTASFDSTTGILTVTFEPVDGFNQHALFLQDGWFNVSGLGEFFDGIKEVGGTTYLTFPKDGVQYVPTLILSVEAPDDAVPVVGPETGMVTKFLIDTSEYINERFITPTGQVSQDTYTYFKLRDRDIWGSDGQLYKIDTVTVSNNVATITTRDPMYVSVGDTVLIEGNPITVGETTSNILELLDKSGGSTVTQVSEDRYSISFSVPEEDAVPDTPTITIPSNKIVYLETQFSRLFEEYAVYAEVPFTPIEEGSDISQTSVLTSAKVFEVLGESRSEPSYSDTTYYVYREYTEDNVYKRILTIGLTDVQGFDIDNQVQIFGLGVPFDGEYTIVAKADFSEPEPTEPANPYPWPAPESGVPYKAIRVEAEEGQFEDPEIVYTEATSGKAVSFRRVPNSELSPAGLSFYGGDGSIVSRLSPTGEDSFISISGATINPQGSGSFRGLSASQNLEVFGATTLHTTNVDGSFTVQNGDLSAPQIFSENVTADMFTVRNIVINTPIPETEETSTLRLIRYYPRARYMQMKTNVVVSTFADANLFARYTDDIAILDRIPRGIIYSTNFDTVSDSAAFNTNANLIVFAAGEFRSDAERELILSGTFGSMYLNSNVSYVTYAELVISNSSGELFKPSGNVDTLYMQRIPANQTAPFLPFQVPIKTVENVLAVGTENRPISLDQNGSSNIYSMGYLQVGPRGNVNSVYWALRYRAITNLNTNISITSVDRHTPGTFNVYDMGALQPASHMRRSNTYTTTYGGNFFVLGNTAPTGNTFNSSPTFNIAGGGFANVSYTLHTVTKIIKAKDSAYYDNGGIGDAGTSDKYANQNSIYQGNPGTSSGTKKSQVSFYPVNAVNLGVPAEAIGTEDGTDPYAPGDVTYKVTKIELYLRNRHSYYASGLKAYWGYTADQTARNSSKPPAPYVAAGQQNSAFDKGQGKYITISSTARDLFANNQIYSILLGLTSASSNSYASTITNYGYFDGENQSDPPRLRVTYTYYTQD